MLRVLIASLSLLFVSRLAVAADSPVTVQVGADGLVFSPSSIKASNGTVVHFVFSGMHSVTQSTFGAPCTHSGFNSARLNAGQTFSISITDDTHPVWIYCNVGSHCGSGMVGAINAPTDGNNFDKFRKAALNIGMSEPPQPDGNVPVAQGDGASAITNSSSTTKASSASSSVSTTSSAPKSTSPSTPSSAPGTLTVPPTFIQTSTVVVSSSPTLAAPSSSTTQTSGATRLLSGAGSVVIVGALVAAVV